MPTTMTVRAAHALALERASAGDAGEALRIYDGLLAHDPLDDEARLRIARLLAALGERDGASAVYRALAIHFTRAGHPLRALLACRALDDLGTPNDDLIGAIAQRYGLGSPKLGRASRRALPDPDAEVTLDDPQPGAALPLFTACARAMDMSGFPYPEAVLPLPLLSELLPALVASLLGVTTLRHFWPGDHVVREGELGAGVFLLATGAARIYVTDPSGRQIERARIGENALFGELALLGPEPRIASVQITEEADVFELSGEALAKLAAARPQLAAALAQFARERLMKNLLAASPLFRPFSAQQQLDLARRFEGHDVPAGTVIIREGEPGRGLYIVLAGEVEVTKRTGASEDDRDEDAADVILARLKAGDMFGEMSLLTGAPTSAAVRARRASTVLFLAREYFQRLVSALPEIRAYIEGLAERRQVENQLTLGNDDVETEAFLV